jgi:hypothetical protein
VINPLPNKKLADVNIRFAPRPKQIPRRTKRAAMRQLLPSFPAKKTSRNDVVHLLFGLYNSIVPIVNLIKLPMQVSIEDLKPFHNFLEVNVGIFSMEKELFGIAELEVVGGVERKKDGRLEVAISVLEVVHVGGEHIGEVSHDHGDILQCLMLCLGVHD